MIPPSPSPGPDPKAAKPAISKRSAVIAGIIGSIFAVEGGYVANKYDPGGETNHGVTKVVARQHGYTGDMKAFSEQLAAPIYYEDYIKKPGYEPFLDLAPAVAEELVDSSVNIGPDKPSRWLQTALNALSAQGTSYPQIPIDGKVSSTTVQAYASLQKVRGKVLACQLIIKSLDAQQGHYYLAISLSNPKLQSFTAGWLSNRIGNVPLSHCG